MSRVPRPDTDTTVKYDLEGKVGDLERRLHRLQGYRSRFRVTPSIDWGIGSGSYEHSVFDLVDYDLSGDYAVEQMLYIAPVTGYYDFSTSLQYRENAAGTTRVIVSLDVNNATRMVELQRVYKLAEWSNDGVLHGFAMDVALDAGDIVCVVVNQNSGLSATVGGTDTGLNFFAGRLAYAG